MHFDSLYFFVFLAVTFLLYYRIGYKFQQLVLFAASIFFIAFLSPKLVVFTLIFVILNYFLGIWLQKKAETRFRVTVFWITIAANIGILGFFKYINFFFENVNLFLSLFNAQGSLKLLDLIIPVGISYYTFQALGYLIRINRKAEKAETSFLAFANYLIFFPKFLAGPVERSNHFFPQISKPVLFQADNVTAGLRLFLWGMFKKVVIGNNLADPVYKLYNNIEDYTGLPLLIIFFLQAIHLYADFSGYTDMALGVARIFGIKLVDNFNRPFFARNVGEFWRRWHISLSSWCNDFIFSPFIVKYRKYGNKAAIAGIFITFYVIGIWHGANWTFVAVGLLQGIAISYEFATKRKRLQIASRLPQGLVTFVSRTLTYLFFSLTLVFFNSQNIHDAFYFLSHIFSDFRFNLSGNKLIYDSASFFVAIIAFGVIYIKEMLQEMKVDVPSYFYGLPRGLRWTGYYLMMVAVFYYSGAGDAFVYLQF
ncbi:D-alanyl-lipoteichoic acid acyltransferase DltB, MBOAT superfamily [Lentimicrobium saccharophilum]|uniref:D-alanyl-lipoteichoic acid acyltransferase DltB, MBOAT superfamily n=1 Tax=Lentimicrobium saccharophilum TaxID=1678841 RepID=A0A0S7BXY1_9BACT|nr:D-alanyl-lipoteichoic acid acyltransferase DltB, MBOAT superfamily [Lentimicrobium saccharophilum]